MKFGHGAMLEGRKINVDVDQANYTLTTYNPR